MPPILEMVSSRKVLGQREKVAAWLRGEPIFPATLELGLTTACDRSCPDCPSRLGEPGLFLAADTARRLFALCRGRTFGAILSGGEPTLHPAFGPILDAAREHGFREVVVISNGSRLDREEVAEPLLRSASAVRVSLYDWHGQRQEEPGPTLRGIARLRAAVDRQRSALQIGVSLLTRGLGLPELRQAAAAVRAAGAHWLYLHPTCVATPEGTEREKGQEAVLSALATLRREQEDGFALHYLSERFSDAPVVFHGYHAARFIMVVGADGSHYLSSEAKYRPRFRLGDEAGYGRDDYFSRPERIAAIAAIGSSGYPAGGGRNRGVLYNRVLEEAMGEARQGRFPEAGEYLLPHIL